MRSRYGKHWVLPQGDVLDDSFIIAYDFGELCICIYIMNVQGKEAVGLLSTNIVHHRPLPRESAFTSQLGAGIGWCR